MRTLAEQHAYGVLHMGQLLRLVVAMALGNAYVMTLAVVGAVGFSQGTSWQHMGLVAGMALAAVPLVAGVPPREPSVQAYAPVISALQPTFYLRAGT